MFITTYMYVCMNAYVYMGMNIHMCAHEYVYVYAYVFRGDYHVININNLSPPLELS